jgi:hypothetical protein
VHHILTIKFNWVDYIGLVIVVEAKLSVLLEVSRTRSGATQILQTQFFEAFRGFSLAPDLLVQLQRIKTYGKSNYANLRIE